MSSALIAVRLADSFHHCETTNLRPIAEVAGTDHPQLMSAYAEVDGVINAWVNAASSTLFREWAGKPARFFHVPGTPPFECFQVSIDPPTANRIVVLARAIDTNDDTEFELEQTWEGSVSELDAILATAMATVERWKAQSPQAEK